MYKIKLPTGPEYLSGREKRVMDLVGSGLAIPAAVPAIGATALTIKSVDRMNPLFRQTRVGNSFAAFIMYKLRTMPEGTPEIPSRSGAREDNATTLGALLRSSHIDELPQFLNVLRGDMSLVGFRPPIEAEVDDIMDSLNGREQREWQAAISRAKPSLFSRYNNQLQQNGYHEHSLRERALDTIDYAATANVQLDMEILHDSLRTVLGGIRHVVTRTSGA